MRRVVLFKRKADARPEDFASALAGLQSLDQRMSEMTSWWLEVNPGGDGMWDAALIADFPDTATQRRYEGHDEHVKAGTAVAAVSDFAVFDSAE